MPLPSSVKKLSAPSIGWAEEELAGLESRGLRRELEPLESPQGPVVHVGGKPLINFSSNDYLGLANDKRVIRACISGLHRHGVGAGASRLLVGDTLAHRSLERTLASFGRAEAVLLFNNGYAANVGIIPSLCGTGDVLFSDQLNHASLIDGSRLSRARLVVYPHRDLVALERGLRTVDGRRRLVITESVFSMDGDRAPIGELVALCRRYGAALLVDEAHAIGVVGPQGRGLCEELRVSSSVDIRVGTLGKALGAFGAFALTSRPVVDLLLNRARSLVFSTALPATLCAGAEAGLEILQSDPALLAALWRNVARFASGLNELGIPAQPSSAIFPVVLREPHRAIRAAKGLRDRGLLVKAIRPPTVPEGESRLRFCISAAHQEAQINQALQALRAELRR